MFSSTKCQATKFSVPLSELSGSIWCSKNWFLFFFFFFWCSILSNKHTKAPHSSDSEDSRVCSKRTRDLDGGAALWSSPQHGHQPRRMEEWKRKYVSLCPPASNCCTSARSIIIQRVRGKPAEDVWGGGRWRWKRNVTRFVKVRVEQWGVRAPAATSSYRCFSFCLSTFFSYKVGRRYSTVAKSW